jgi:hypothetical protein
MYLLDIFLTSVHKDSGGFAAALYLSDMQWIGVVGYFPEFAYPDRNQLFHVK